MNLICLFYTLRSNLMLFSIWLLGLCCLWLWEGFQVDLVSLPPVPILLFFKYLLFFPLQVLQAYFYFLCPAVESVSFFYWRIVFTNQNVDSVMLLHLDVLGTELGSICLFTNPGIHTHLQLFQDLCLFIYVNLNMSSYYFQF